MSTSKFISCLLLKTPFELAGITSKQLIIIEWAFVAEEIGCRGFLTKKSAIIKWEISISLTKLKQR